MKKHIFRTVLAAILLLSLFAACSESLINAEVEIAVPAAGSSEDASEEENRDEIPEEAPAEETVIDDIVVETFAMPDVVGKNEDEARKTLNDLQLAVEFDYESSDEIPEGTVIRQDVPPETEVGIGTEVLITVSIGQNSISTISVLHLPSKTDYFVGEKLDTNGLTLQVTYKNGKSGYVSTGFEVSPETLTEAGTRTIDVVYQGFSADFEVNVEPETLTGIEIKTGPDKTSYYLNERLDPTGLVLTASYSSGVTKTINAGYECTPETLTETGEQKITVSYEGAKTGCTVTVYGADRILSENDPKGKPESEAQKTFEPYGINLSVEYADADEVHVGKVLAGKATSDQSIKLIIGKQTDFTFEEKNGSIVITGVSRTTDFLNIPDTINGLTVTEIADYAFDESDSNGDNGLRKVKFPSGLVRIGEGAFCACRYLEEALLPDSIEEIGDGAFWDCSALTEVAFGKVKTVGNFAFQYCIGIKEVLLPNTCTSIGEEAFSGLMFAKKIVVPASVAYIGPGAFTDCVRAEFETAEGSYAADYLAESNMGGT